MMKSRSCFAFCLSILIFLASVNESHGQQVSLKNRKNASIAYNDGIKSIQEENYWVALEYLSAALDYNPQFDMAYLARGKVNLQLNNIQESVQDFTMAIEMHLLT